MTTAIDRTLRHVLSGDVASLGDLETSGLDLSTVNEHAFPLILTATAVAAVLRGFAAGHISGSDAQRWAALMRWGYVGGTSAQLLEIEFEPEHEEAISECIARLDELGDLIDGELRPGEPHDLLCALEGTSPTRPD